MTQETKSEFEKARDEHFQKLMNEDHWYSSVYNKKDIHSLCADWAYEWCAKDINDWALEAAHWKNKAKALETKLQIAVEALEKVGMFSGNVDAVHGCHLCHKTAKRALAKIKGSEGES